METNATRHEEWLKAHTFRCAVGRVTPKQCEELRSRPTIEEVNSPEWRFPKDGKPVRIRPDACSRCTDYERQIEDLRGRNKTMETAKTADSTMDDGRATKTCKRCGRERPLDQFPSSALARDGRMSVCRECFTEATHSWRKIKVQDGKKPCSRCKRTLPLSAFHRDSKSATGYASMCKECKAEALTKKPKKRGRDVGASSAAGKRRGVPDSPADATITLDFGAYQGLLEWVKTEAVRQFRPADLQILWLLQQAKEASHGQGCRDIDG